MKKIFTTVTIALCFWSAVLGQTDGNVFQRLLPTFQKHDVNYFGNWVKEVILFELGEKTEYISGKIVLQFTVKTDGSVDNVKVLSSINPWVNNEIARIIQSSPKWEWHTDNPNPFTFTLPITFPENPENPYPCDKFEFSPKGLSGELSIYSITHGSIVIASSSHTIIVDPVMKMANKVFLYRWFKQGKFTVLLTHEHSDHFSKETIKYLTASSKPDNYAIYGNLHSIDTLGVGTVLNNGDAVSVDHGNVKITAVAAYNTTEGHLMFHPKGNGNGYLIDIDNKIVYVAGDTEVIPEMETLGNVDVAILPVNQPYTMTPEQCIEAAKIINPKVLIPYHMGTTDITPVLKAFENTDIKVIFHEELR